MTTDDFVTQIRRDWLDTNGLVKAQPEWVTSGNGLLYSCIADFLSDYPVVDRSKTGACFKKKGLLMRNPQNSFGQEQFDDYLGMAVSAVKFKYSRMAKGFCWRGVFHLGFYLNVPFTWSNLGKSFLWRFPEVWLLMWCAAYPWLKWPLLPAFMIFAAFTNLDESDPGGIQLSWLFLEGMHLIYKDDQELLFDELRKARRMLPKAFSQYYHHSHPFIQFVTETRWT